LNSFEIGLAIVSNDQLTGSNGHAQE
jgi:hypothetical protein